MRSAGRDRVDRMILRGFLLVGAVGGLLSAVAIPVRALRDDRLFWEGSVGYGTDFPDDDLVRPKDGASFYWDGHLDVRIDDATTRLRMLVALPETLSALAFGLVCLMLLLLLLDTHGGRPFLRRNLNRLRIAACVIFVAAALVPLARAWANEEVMTAAVTPSGVDHGLFDYDPSVTIMWLLIGLLVLAVAEAFRIGGRLAEDTEGLV